MLFGRATRPLSGRSWPEPGGSRRRDGGGVRDRARGAAPAAVAAGGGTHPGRRPWRSGSARARRASRSTCASTRCRSRWPWSSPASGRCIHLYAIGYMEHDPRPGAVLRLHEPVLRVHARARPGERLPAALPRLGRRGALLVPADRVLVGPSRGGARREEGVHHDPRRRRAADARAVRDVGALRLVRLRRRARSRGLAARDRRRHRDRDLAAAARRRGGQVGPAAAARLAARRDGRARPPSRR